MCAGVPPPPMFPLPPSNPGPSPPTTKPQSLHKILTLQGSSYPLSPREPCRKIMHGPAGCQSQRPNYKQSMQCHLGFWNRQCCVFQVNIGPQLQQESDFGHLLCKVREACTILWNPSLTTRLLNFLVQRLSEESRSFLLFFCLDI